MTFPLIYSLWGFSLKQRAHEFFSGGHPRRFEVTLTLPILTLMNIHIVQLPVFSIANMHVRTSKSQPFLGSESGSEYNKQQQQNTLIADTITGNPVVYIVGYKKIKKIKKYFVKKG